MEVSFRMSTILASVPKPKYVQRGVLDLVPNFVFADDDSTDFARLELGELLTDTRMIDQAAASNRQCAHRVGGGSRIDRR